MTTKVTKEKGPLTFTEFKPEFPDSEIKKTSMAPTINENPSIIKEVMRKKEPIKQEVKENQVLKSKKSGELIINLVIVNLGKTVSAIKSLDTVYTM